MQAVGIIWLVGWVVVAVWAWRAAILDGPRHYWPFGVAVTAGGWLWPVGVLAALNWRKMRDRNS